MTSTAFTRIGMGHHRKYFFMGSFLATQIDAGATIYNQRVQLWQGWWGFRPLYMWILVQKNEFFCEKCPEDCHLKAGRVYKPVFIKIWSISSQKVYLGQTRPPVRWCLNRRFKKSILVLFTTLKASIRVVQNTNIFENHISHRFFLLILPY